MGAVGIALTAAALVAFGVAHRRRERARQLAAVSRAPSLDAARAELRHGHDAAYVALRGLVHAAQPLLATRWAGPTAVHSVAVRRVQTQLIDVQEVVAAPAAVTANNPTNNWNAANAAVDHGGSVHAASSASSHWRRVQEVLHDDFETIPFAIRDHTGADVRVLANPSQLPLTRVANDFVPVAAANAGGVHVNVNVGNSGPLLGQVDRRVVGHQNEEFVVACDRPLLVVGELRRALDPDDAGAFVIGEPRSLQFKGHPFIVSHLSLDELIAESEASAALARQVFEVAGSLGVACVLAGALVRTFSD